MKKVLPIVLLFSILLFTGCNTLLKGLSDSIYQQKDVVLIEDGAPTYLLLIEGLIKSDPKNKMYLMTGIQMNVAYAGAFVKDTNRKKIFADKTKEWAFQVLRSNSNFTAYEKAKDKEQKDLNYEKFVKSITKNDINNIFWCTNAWINWILANLDTTDAFLELPRAKELIDRIRVLDDKYYYGAPHLYYGVFYGAFPKDFGGNMELAKKEFDIALNLSGDKFLTAKMFYANFYLKPNNMKEECIKILKEVINTDVGKFPENRLVNLIAQKEAETMLLNIDDLFFDVK